MPWAEQRSNGNWRACWRTDTGRTRSISRDPQTNKLFTRKAHAERIAGSEETRARNGEATSDGRAPTWGEWAPQWQGARIAEASTIKQDQGRIDRYLIPYWGEKRLNKITRTKVQAWVNLLAKSPAYKSVPKRPPAGWTPPEVKPIAPATVDRIFQLFSGSMKAAAEDESIPISANPCKGVRRPQIAPGHERYLTWGEVVHVSFHLGEPYWTAAWTLVGTGMRFGEFAGMHWQRVDMAAGTIDIVETWDPASGAIKAYPKGRGKSRRTVPIPRWLRPLLEAQLARTGPGGSCGLRHSSGVRCRSGLVVPAPGGGPIDGHNFGQRDWATAVKLAGIGHVRLHDLRHTYASWLRQAGIDLEEVQRLLGHDSITTTQRYSHLGSTQHAAVLAALNGQG